MRFDFTKGKTARYMVTIYMHNGCADHIYYHYYREAVAKFRSLKDGGSYEAGTIFSIYDLDKDIQKAFARA